MSLLIERLEKYIQIEKMVDRINQLASGDHEKIVDLENKLLSRDYNAKILGSGFQKVLYY